MKQSELFALDSIATKTIESFTKQDRSRKGALSKHDAALDCIKATFGRFKLAHDKYNSLGSSLRGVIQRVLPDIEAKDATINNVLDRKRKTIRTYLIDNTKYDPKYITQTLSRVFADIALASNPEKASKPNAKTNRKAVGILEDYCAKNPGMTYGEAAKDLRAASTEAAKRDRIEKAKAAKAKADRKAKAEARTAKDVAATTKKVTKKAA